MKHQGEGGRTMKEGPDDKEIEGGGEVLTLNEIIS